MLSLETLHRSFDALPKGAREMFVHAYNAAYEEDEDEAVAAAAGFAAIKGRYRRDGDRWVRKEQPFQIDIEIEKSDDEQQIAFGWLYMTNDETGAQVIDHSGEYILIEDLEKAAYHFVLDSRQAGEMHARTSGVGRVVESMVFTEEKYRALGIDPEGKPMGWWVGFKVDDPEVWSKVRSGEYKMLSIGGYSNVTDE